MTVKAVRLLQQAEVVVYDRLVSDDILSLIPAGVSRIYDGLRVRVPERPGSEPNNVAPPVAREEGVEGQRR